MEANQSPTPTGTLRTDPATPTVIEQLAARLQSDCGNGRVEISDEGFSHAQTQRRFTLTVISKQHRLMSLFNLKDVEILAVTPKRSGAEVRTTISLKVIATS